MATNQEHIVDVGCAADRISDLPDHLLHRILIRLPTTAAAARTSVLSRRWRRVWRDLPELALRPPSSPLERIGAALDACAAPVLDRLEIALPDGSNSYFYGNDVTAAHVSSWLRFASRRVAGELRLSLPPPPCRSRGQQDVVLVLPLCARLTAIALTFRSHVLRFQLLPAAGAGGAFTALATLTIYCARVDGGELADVLSSRCPRLKELVLEYVTLLDYRDDPVLSVRSGSLERLRVCTMYPGGGLIVDTPELQALQLPWIFCDAHIIAPKLSEVEWGKHFYNPSHHQLVETGRHLRRQEMAINSPAAALMGRFDAADELTLNISVSEGVEEYNKFLEDTKKLARCEVLVVRFSNMEHAFQPVILHLLRKCRGIRKLVVQMGTTMIYDPCKCARCPCDLLHNHDTDGVVLDSLEVEVERGGKANHKMSLMYLLCRCSATFQKKVSITILKDEQNQWYMRRKIGTLTPNDRFEVTMY